MVYLVHLQKIMASVFRPEKNIYLVSRFVASKFNVFGHQFFCSEITIGDKGAFIKDVCVWGSGYNMKTNTSYKKINLKNYRKGGKWFWNTEKMLMSFMNAPWTLDTTIVPTHQHYHKSVPFLIKCPQLFTWILSVYKIQWTIKQVNNWCLSVHNE